MFTGVDEPETCGLWPTSRLLRNRSAFSRNHLPCTRTNIEEPTTGSICIGFVSTPQCLPRYRRYHHALDTPRSAHGCRSVSEPARRTTPDAAPPLRPRAACFQRPALLVPLDAPSCPVAAHRPPRRPEPQHRPGGRRTLDSGCAPRSAGPRPSRPAPVYRAPRTDSSCAPVPLPGPPLALAVASGPVSGQARRPAGPSRGSDRPRVGRLPSHGRRPGPGPGRPAARGRARRDSRHRRRVSLRRNCASWNSGLPFGNLPRLGARTSTDADPSTNDAPARRKAESP